MLLAVVSWPAKRKMKELPRISSEVKRGGGDLRDEEVVALLDWSILVPVAVIRGTEHGC